MLCSLLFHKFSFKHREQEPTICLPVSLFLVVLLLKAGPGGAHVAAEQTLTLCHQRVDETRTSPARPISSCPSPAEHPCPGSPRPRPAGAPWLLSTAQRCHSETQKKRRTHPNSLHQFRQKICQRRGLLNVFIWVSTGVHFNKIARACSMAPYKLILKPSHFPLLSHLSPSPPADRSSTRPQLSPGNQVENITGVCLHFSLQSHTRKGTAI